MRSEESLVATIATVSRAHIEYETPAKLVVASTSARWVLLLFFGFLAFSGGTLAFLTATTGRDVPTAIIVAAIFLLSGLLLSFFAAVTVKIIFSPDTQTIALAKEYFLGFGPLPRVRAKQWAFQDVARIDHRTFFRTNNVELATNNGQRILLSFGANQADAARTAQLVATWLKFPSESIIPQAIGSIPASPVNAHALMQREIKSWGYWSIGLGVVHFLASGTLSVSWGIVLLIVGAASFYFREAAMFVIYGVTMGWVAVSNLLNSGPGAWWILALLQFYWSFQLFRHFFAFKKAQAALSTPEANSSATADSSPAARIFPWGGCLLGGLSLIGFGAMFVGIFIMAFSGIGQNDLLSLLETISVRTALLGVAVASASLLSGFQHKALASVGLAAGSLVILVELALAVLF